MTTVQIADNDARVQYTQAVNGLDNDPSPAATELTIDFPFFELDDINVIRTTVLGVDTVLSRGTGAGTFTVTGTSVDDGFSGGNVKVHDTDSATDTTYTIFRDIPIERTTDFPTSGPFNISSLNTELDKAFAIMQELETNLGRALILRESDTLASITLPSVNQRSNKILSFDSNGEAIASQSIGVFQGSDATVTTQDYLRHDLVKSTTAGQLDNVYIAMQDSPSGTLLTNTTYWALVVDAVSAATFASNAASSASTAEGHKDNAEAAQTAAETAQASAETAYDDFDDRYLGAKATDPTVDNDGDALITGALYFNTTDGDMRVYNGSAFINVVSSLGNLANIVEDTTPQLGGNLASNGQDILMADNDAVIIGTDTDLTIVHDSGVNNTLFKSDTLEFKSKANANLTFKISPGATKAATLYYQGSERLAIESGTTRFTGGINTDTATIASLAYPTSDGTNGQVLTTNGSGTLSFQDVTESDPSALAFAIALG